VGVAGSVTTITAAALGLQEYRRERIDGARLTLEQVHAACEQMLTLPREARAALGFMHPGRVDVIGAGALIWSEVVARVAREVVDGGGHLDQVITSEHDILDGIARSVQVGTGTPPHPANARLRGSRSACRREGERSRTQVRSAGWCPRTGRSCCRRGPGTPPTRTSH